MGTCPTDKQCSFSQEQPVSQITRNSILSPISICDSGNQPSLQRLNYPVSFYFFTSVFHLRADIPSPILVLSHPNRCSGSGDEEGPVSSGRELTLQGAGKSWVGVLPSSDLGLVGRGGAGEEEEARRMTRSWTGEVRDPDGREELPLVEPSSSSSLCSSFLPAA